MAHLCDSTALFDPQRWGLPAEVVESLGERLYQFWQRFRPCFKTRTRDSSARAYDYLRGQLTMDTDRTFTAIDRTVRGGDGQATQHFMSNSPWSAQAVFAQLQAEIAATPGLQQGGVVILDESADEKSGPDSVGAARQYNGRLGKVDLCRVDTCLSYAQVSAGVWAMVDGELFLPEAWFAPEKAEKRLALGIPPERTFETKIQLGLKMIRRAQAQGLPFEWVACDTLYGRDRPFRATLAALGLGYAAQVPATTQVYLHPPQVGLPAKRYRQGRQPGRLQVLSTERPHPVQHLAHRPWMRWRHGQVRPSERGLLEADFAVRRVWTLTPENTPRAEWLVIRRQADGQHTYTLLNAPAHTPAQQLIEWSCQRYFTERTFEEAKTEIGWDEFQGQKYRAWEHHLALTALALWFVVQTKRQWASTYARDPQLAQQLAVELLPALSTANVRELLKAVLPLPQLTPQQATQIVITHLVNRARSMRCRWEAQAQHRGPP